LDTANRETDRLTRLVNDVLDLSRLESSRSYTFDAIDLVQPIEQTLRTYQLNARDKGIELTQELAPNLPPVLGNYDLLLQVFANLVGNALKFTPKGGQVAIRAYIPQDPAVQPALWDTCPVNAATGPAKSQSEVVSVVRVEVADTGIGIGPEDCHAIFDRFYRVENRVHTLEGTGLGLSIVRNIIDKHQSSVKLISEVGVGTIFWFDLLIYRDGLTLPEPMPVVSSTLG
jgi:two-component system sensor histidine kinase NblS